jgi:hypothetical protein
VFFFHKEESWAGDDIFLDLSGNEMWRLPYNSIVSTFGYLADGSPEFVFADNQDSVEARNVSGDLIWRTAGIGWAFGMEVLQAYEGRDLQVLIVANGNLVALGSHGQILFARKPSVEGYFSAFSLIRWPTVCEDQCILVMRNDNAVVLTPDGEKVVRNLGPSHYLQDTHGLAVRFYRDEPPLLAVTGFLYWKQPSKTVVHGVLYIFNPDGHVVYHEVFPERVDALYALPHDGRIETLLVGGENKIWEYSAKPDNQVKQNP